MVIRIFIIAHLPPPEQIYLNSVNEERAYIKQSNIRSSFHFPIVLFIYIKYSSHIQGDLKVFRQPHLATFSPAPSSQFRASKASIHFFFSILIHITYSSHIHGALKAFRQAHSALKAPSCAR